MSINPEDHPSFRIDAVREVWDERDRRRLACANGVISVPVRFTFKVDRSWQTVTRSTVEDQMRHYVRRITHSHRSVTQHLMETYTDADMLERHIAKLPVEERIAMLQRALQDAMNPTTTP